MFIEALKTQNPALIQSARKLWQQGAILPDSCVIDVDQVMENGRRLLMAAAHHDIRLYLMTKQLGRNPWLAKRLIALGFRGAVAVDFKEARRMRNAGVPVSHAGHLVQVPTSQIPETVAASTDIVTVFSLEKAREISVAAQQCGYTQPIMLKIQLAGLTHFPCLLWDEERQQTLPAPNLQTLLEARDKLHQRGIEISQINAPSASGCSTLSLLAQHGVTHAEPGHALIGTIPSNKHGEQEERIAMLYLSEISHQFQGNSYCFGGGYYRRGHAQSALVYPPAGEAAVPASLLPVDDLSIDYHLPLAGKFPIASPVVMCFRTQIFVTRCDVALVSGVQAGKPVLEALYDSLGNLISGGLHE